MDEPKKHEEEKITQADKAFEENMSSSENELEMLKTENEQRKIQ